MNPVVREKPCLEPCQDPVEKVFPSLSPACVATRAMSTKIQEEKEELKLADTIVGKEFNEEPLEIPKVYVENGLSECGDEMSTPSFLQNRGKTQISQVYLTE